ncbi:MAG: hypothetical protein KC591_13440 [Gemmatimonadetes bacterium]|nr:hypothetical protein [Gemmatimonadota bacterium]
MFVRPSAAEIAASLFVVSFVIASTLTPAGPAAADVFWSVNVSESPTECWLTSGPDFTGEKTLYLSLCGDFPLAMEFGLETTFDEIVSITPATGVSITGPLDSMQFCLAGAAADPWGVVATLVVRDTDGSGGGVCFTPSTERGRVCYAYNCDDFNWTSAFWTPLGYSTASGVACSTPVTDCGPNPVESEGWGRVKALHR